MKPKPSPLEPQAIAILELAGKLDLRDVRAILEITSKFGAAEAREILEFADRLGGYDEAIVAFRRFIRQIAGTAKQPIPGGGVKG